MFSKSGKDIYLIRHGETTWNFSRKIQGQRNPPLTKLGKRQAAAAAGYFSHLRQTDFKIFSSDLRRAKETAKCFSEVLKKRILYEKGIREIALGDWEGMTPEEVDFHFDDGFKKWLLKPSRIVIPGAETIKDFQARIKKAWTALLPKFHDNNTVIVTHGGVITALLAWWLKADFDALILRLVIDNGSITHVRVSGERVIVMSVNSVSHIHHFLEE
ncbi:MAG: histidine phosphatase family protein [bacterium]|nr:histidine phosphatase family protein [bacterium]